MKRAVSSALIIGRMSTKWIQKCKLNIGVSTFVEYTQTKTAMI